MPSFSSRGMGNCIFYFLSGFLFFDCEIFGESILHASVYQKTIANRFNVEGNGLDSLSLHLSKLSIGFHKIRTTRFILSFKLKRIH
jgi:hypothetical protein